MRTTTEALLSPEVIADLVQRMEWVPQLLRRQEEEAITALVNLPADWLEQQRESFVSDQDLASVLESRGWTSQDLDLHLARPEALRRYAVQRFGPGLEELFLSAGGGHDQIVYSLLRVRDAALAQELWIRLEEAETTFAEAASAYSEGPEAARKGVIGPMAMGQLQPPQLTELLRSLQPGSLHPPTQLGEWFVLLRLEQLTPARFDEAMREFLLNQELDRFLQERVQKRLAGSALEPLHYDPQP